MISYSPRAARAIGYLKKKYNDLEIFVEDTASQNMWIRLLRRLVPKRFKLKSVNMLGGKDKVIAACRLDQKKDGRRKLYIVDGDFDFLLGKSKPKLMYLYRIGAYCVENLLLHHRGVTEVGTDCEANLSRQSVKLRFDSKSFKDHHLPTLRALFTVYAAANEVASSVKTTSLPVMPLTVTNADGVISFCPIKVGARVRAVVREATKIAGVKQFRTARVAATKRASTLTIDQIVSGKDYLFPLIWHQMRRLLGYNGNKDQFRIHLAKEFLPSFEPGLARRIREISA
jgi:hypothetical protein